MVKSIISQLTKITNLIMSKNFLFLNTIVKWTPDNIGLAIAVLLILFAMKSVTIVIPLSVLYLSSGIMFSGPVAVLVSTAGLMITITIPYVIGRCFGDKAESFVDRKYPEIKKIISINPENMFFICFVTRVAGIFPADILSLYFGVCQIPYKTYMLAGVSGSLLSIITTTLLGNELENPRSKEFIVVLVLRIAITVISFYINRSVTAKEKCANEIISRPPT